MSKFRFTPKMFDTGSNLVNEEYAQAANAALDEHLKGLQRVYHSRYGQWHEFGVTADFTRSAYLFDIEELKPKECEHVALNVRGDLKYVCNDCGKVLDYRLVEV